MSGLRNLNTARTPSRLSAEDIERLREPKRWDDFSKETAALKARKIKDAKRLGVPAVYFTKGQVQDRTRELSKVEYATQQQFGNIYAILLDGGALFGLDYTRQVRARSSHVTNSPVVEYMKVSRLGDEQTGLEVMEIILALQAKALLKATKVTLVDEVGDMGETAHQARTFVRAQYEDLTGDPDLPVGLRLGSDKGLANYALFGSDVQIGFYIPPPWGSCWGMDGKWEYMIPDTEKKIILNEVNRMDGEIALSRVQKEEYREYLPEVLDTLGDRALTHDLDDFIFLPAKKAA